MAHQLSVDVAEKGSGVLVVLFSLGSYEVHGKLIEMIEDGAADLFVSGVSRPEVGRFSAGDAGHVLER